MPNWDVFSATCPTRDLLDRLGDKWAVCTLSLLCREPMRFNDIRRRIEGISQKMLSQTLKNLERDGLVRRQAFATVPVTVEYSITSLGQTLNTTIDALRLWATQHMDDVLEAQQSYDRAGLPAAGQSRPGRGRQSSVPLT